jgi:hypothetical protein
MVLVHRGEDTNAVVSAIEMFESKWEETSDARTWNSVCTALRALLAQR